MKLLFLGDIVGRHGRKAALEYINKIKNEIEIDIIIVNGENSAGGYGITDEIVKQYIEAGIDVITSGNHIFDQKKFIDLLEKEERLLRPINYPSEVIGKGYFILEKKGKKILIISAQGRVFIQPIDCPFKIVEKILQEYQDIKNIFIDFHAEATAEKQAFAYYFAGKVTGIFGTHTHVQTADERIIGDYTAYITDVGMCGGFDSIIGVEPEGPLKRMIQGIPASLTPSSKNVWINGVLVDFDEETGKALSITRLQEKMFN